MIGPDGFTPLAGDVTPGRIPPTHHEHDAADGASEHDFLPVAGHPDDDECTYRADGTDATYCGQTRAWHEHHPKCYQNTGVPDDLPANLCDCRVLRMMDAEVER